MVDTSQTETRTYADDTEIPLPTETVGGDDEWWADVTKYLYEEGYIGPVEKVKSCSLNATIGEPVTISNITTERTVVSSGTND